MSNRFIAGVGDGAVDIGHACPYKILRRTHFQIGKFEVGSVRMRSSRALGSAASQQSNDADHDHDQRHTKQNRAQVRVAILFSQRRWLDETAHAIRLYYRRS